MLKGTQKQIIFLKDTKSGIFDEAYFVIKPSGVEGLSRSDMVEEANRIISSSLISEEPLKKKGKKKNTSAFWFTIMGVCIGIILCTVLYFIFRRLL